MAFTDVPPLQPHLWVKGGLEPGAHALTLPADAFRVARYARITDPFGHIWAFNAPLEQP